MKHLVSDGEGEIYPPGTILYPSTLDQFRHNAQLEANAEQITMYIYEYVGQEGFYRYGFLDRDDYDEKHNEVRFVEAVDPNP